MGTSLSMWSWVLPLPVRRPRRVLCGESTHGRAAQDSLQRPMLLKSHRLQPGGGSLDRHGTASQCRGSNERSLPGSLGSKKYRGKFRESLRRPCSEARQTTSVASFCFGAVRGPASKVIMKDVTEGLRGTLKRHRLCFTTMSFSTLGPRKQKPMSIGEGQVECSHGRSCRRDVIEHGRNPEGAAATGQPLGCTVCSLGVAAVSRGLADTFR